MSRYILKIDNRKQICDLFYNTVIRKYILINIYPIIYFIEF
jgi:hypothetical protein